jgi:hypothetical protein
MSRVVSGISVIDFHRSKRKDYCLFKKAKREAHKLAEQPTEGASEPFRRFGEDFAD